MARGTMAQVENAMDYGKWLLAGLAAITQSIPELTYFLLILMGIDMLFGIAAAVKQNRISPREAWRGATRKLGSMGIIVLAAVIDKYVDLLGIDLVQVSTVFYIGPEILSILRNAAILEVPVPPQFGKVLAYFEDKGAASDKNKSLP